MTRAAAAGVVLLGTLFSLLSSGGCADRGSLPEVAAEGAQWLQSIRQAHLRADAALADHDTARAEALLEAALTADVPTEVQPRDRRVVHQDLLFRLALLSLDGGAHAEALARARRGLLLDRAGDMFTANLLVVEGEALSAAGRDTEAASAFYEALEINQELLTQALQGGAGSGP